MQSYHLLRYCQLLLICIFVCLFFVVVVFPSCFDYIVCFCTSVHYLVLPLTVSLETVQQKNRAPRLLLSVFLILPASSDPENVTFSLTLRTDATPDLSRYVRTFLEHKAPTRLVLGYNLMRVRFCVRVRLVCSSTSEFD